MFIPKPEAVNQAMEELMGNRYKIAELCRELDELIPDGQMDAILRSDEEKRDKAREITKKIYELSGPVKKSLEEAVYQLISDCLPEKHLGKSRAVAGWLSIDDIKQDPG